MLRLVIIAAVIGALVYNNATIKDFKIEAKKMIQEDESTARASWSAVTRVTGLNALAKATGLGNYQICRQNLYVASIFQVRDDRWLDSKSPAAVGFGAIGHVWIHRISDAPEQNSFIAQKISDLAAQLNFTECETAHRSGDFSID